MPLAVASSTARRERRVAHRRQGILDAAARIFPRGGYERAPLDTIGEAVGLSKASLYYYVRSKEELLGRLLSGVIEEIARRATRNLPTWASAEERLRRFLVAHVEVVCGDPSGAPPGFPRRHDRPPGTRPDEIAQTLFSLVVDGLRARSTSTSRRNAHAK